ncbi:GumC family protein [Roseibium sp.]|uniref:GumC family protein n=1 Tax=Roseibium sp. TaxID=1936156 RepID=UPI003A969547
MIDIEDVPGLLRRHKRTLVALPVATILLSLFYVALKTPSYRASSELLLQTENLGLVTADQSFNRPAAATQSTDLNSQIYVITSAPVLNEVSNRLDLDNDPALHKAGLLRRLFGGIAASLSDTEKRAATLSALRHALTVSRLDNSLVFRISAEHPDANKAAAIANTVASAYIFQVSQSQAETLRKTSSTLGVQAKELRQRLEAAEASVEEYKARKGLISTGQGGLVVDQQIQALNTRLTEARVALEAARSTYLLVNSLTAADIEAGALPERVTDSVLSALRVQYAQIEQQTAEMATTLGAAHPTLREMRSQLENTRRQITAELKRRQLNIKTEYEQAQTTVAALERQLNDLQSTNSAQGQALIELRQLQSEADASRAIYEAFLKRSRELEEQPDLTANSTKILQEALVPTAPSGPRKLIVIIAAGLFGFALAVAAIIGKAILWGTISTPKDLARLTLLPVLAQIPSGKGSTALSTGKLLPAFGFAQRQRANRNGLEMSRLAYAIRQAFEDATPANVLVLATRPSADTRNFTRDLSSALSDIGQRVLLASTANGLPDVISQDEKGILADSATALGKINSLIRHISGAPESSETGDLRSPMLSKYIQVSSVGARRKYASQAELTQDGDDDYLLIDGGAAMDNPVLPVLLRHCDGILLVSSLGKARTADVHETLAYLQPWKDRIIGNVVLDAA